MKTDEIRRKIDKIITYLGYYLELYLDYIKDYCRTEPKKAITVGTVILILITVVAICISHKPEREIKPIITSEEQAIMIAKGEYEYGDVKSTRIVAGIWYVQMDLPLPLVVPALNMTTKQVIVCINSTSGNTMVLTPEGYVIKGSEL